MTVQITTDTGAALDGQVKLTELKPSVTRTIRLTNAHTTRLTSIKLWVVNDPALPAQRRVTVNGIVVAGTDEASATEVLTDPLEVGASLTGEDAFTIDPAVFKEGYDAGTLHFVAYPEA